MRKNTGKENRKSGRMKKKILYLVLGKYEEKILGEKVK